MTGDTSMHCTNVDNYIDYEIYDADSNEPIIGNCTDSESVLRELFEHQSSMPMNTHDFDSLTLCTHCMTLKSKQCNRIFIVSHTTFLFVIMGDVM